MATSQLCWPPAILFYRCRLHLSFFRRLNLEVAWPIVNKLCHVRRWCRFIKFGQKFVWPLSSRNLAAQNIKISARFRTTSRLDHEYLRNATRRGQSEYGITNKGHSRTGKFHSVYFGPQTAKNRTGVLTHPTGGHQAGQCHAYSFNDDLVRMHLVSFLHSAVLFFGL